MLILYLYFNFNILTLYFDLILGVTPLTLLYINFWKFFIGNNYFYYRIKPLSFDKINKTNFFKKLKYTVFIRLGLVFFILYFIFLSSFLTESLSFFWNHLKFDNFKIWFFYSLFFINMVGFFFLKTVFKNKIPQSIDFFFSIINLVCIIPLLFISNTFFTFFFLIELISILIFYKFIVSKIWFKFNNNFFKKNKIIKITPRFYLNILFFQFWSNFFSTVLILITLIVFFYLYNSTEWVIIHYIHIINNNMQYINNNGFFVFILFPLMVGIFLKLGMSPLHLYKIEVYKGLPLLSIFFYTTYFFFAFVSFFSYMGLFLLNVFSIYWIYFFSITFIIGAILLISLLFDVQYVKAFFAYSTIINVTLIMLLLILSLSF